jgi:phosphate uptake regulator
MRRKLIQHGPASLVVTLPHKWITAHKLKKGEEIEMTQERNRLVISLAGMPVKKRLTIDLSGTRFLQRHLNIAYIQGYDEIELKKDKRTDYSEIRKAAAGLIGFQVIDQDGSRLLIRSLSEAIHEVDSVVRRLFHLFQAIAELAMLQARKGGQEKEIAEMNSMVDSLRFFCLRRINRQGYHEDAYSSYLVYIISMIEQACDGFNTLASLMHARDRKAAGLLANLSGYIREMTVAFYRPDVRRLPALKRMHERLMGLHQGLAKDDVSCCLYSILQLVRHIESSIFYDWAPGSR